MHVARICSSAHHSVEIGLSRESWASGALVVAHPFGRHGEPQERALQLHVANQKQSLRLRRTP